MQPEPQGKFVPNQLREAVKQVLIEMLGISAEQQVVRQWYDTDPAYTHLGLDSPEQLRDMVRNGLLRIGHEVRDIRADGSEKPRYQFHISKCETRLCEPPEKRFNNLRSRRKNAA